MLKCSLVSFFAMTYKGYITVKHIDNYNFAFLSEFKNRAGLMVHPMWQSYFAIVIEKPHREIVIQRHFFQMFQFGSGPVSLEIKKSRLLNRTLLAENLTSMSTKNLIRFGE